MKIADVELTYLDVPFTPHTNEHMQYWLPHWRIVQVCRITLDNGVTGWGETIPNYTWAGVPGDIRERIVGREAGDLLWEDGLGARRPDCAFRRSGQSLEHSCLPASGGRRSGNGVRSPGGRWTCLPKTGRNNAPMRPGRGTCPPNSRRGPGMICTQPSRPSFRTCPPSSSWTWTFNGTLAERGQCRRVPQDPRTVRAGRHDRNPDSAG